jgi:O-antigen ligase
MEILQALVIGLAALILTPGFLFYFDVTPKVVVVLLGTAILLLWDAFKREAGGRLSRVFTVLVVLQLTSLGLSAVLSERQALSVVGSNWRRFGLVTQAAVFLFAWMLAWRAAGRPDRVRTILRGVSATGVLVASFGILQYSGWDPLVGGAAYHIGEGFWTIVRPPGTLGYVSYFANWLLVTIFLSLVLARNEADLIWRRIAYTSAALSFVAMLLTGTRAALLGLGAGLCVWLFRSGFRVSRAWILAGVGVCLAMAGFYVSPPGQPLRSRMRWFVEDPWGGARPSLWRDSLAMFWHRPIAGYGPEVFTATFPHFESEKLARAYPDFIHESPHNIFLDAAVSQGVIGVSILALLFAVGFRKASAGLAAALAAAVVAQQFTVFTVPTALITFVTLALAVACDAGPPVEGKEPFAAVRYATPLFAMVFLYVAIRLAGADYELALAQRSLKHNDAASAAADYASYVHWRLPGSSADLWYSRANLDLARKAANPMVRFQTLIQAGAAGVRATQTSEDPVNAWYSLATLYAAQNDAADTERCLRSAIAASPTWFKPHWTLAQVLVLEGKLADAEQEAATAVRLNGGKNPEVSETLEHIRAQTGRQ